MRKVRKLVFELFILSLLPFMSTEVGAQNLGASDVKRVLALSLDNETAFPGYFGSNFHYASDKKVFVYYNQITSSLKYFDVASGVNLGETRLQTLGPNSVGQEPYYSHYHTQDSIFVFARFGKLALTLVNDQGTKVGEFDFGSISDFSQVPYPRMSNGFGGIEVVGSRIYMGLQVAHNLYNNTKAPVIIIDMVTGKYEYLKMPIPYTELNFKRLPKSGQIEFYESRLMIDRADSSLILTYPVPEDIFKISDKIVERISLQSEKPIGDFDFLKADNNNYSNSDVEYTKIIMTNPRNLGSLYDAFNEVYYFIRKTKGDPKLYDKMINGLGKFYYDYSYEVYDKEFNLLDLKVISSKHLVPNKGVVVSPEGLWVLMPQGDNEDIMELALLNLNLVKN